MLGLISFRVYLFISAIVAAVLFLIYQFDTGQIFLGFVRSTGATSAGALGATVPNFVTIPIEWSVSSFYSVIIAGLLWPLAAVWLVLFLALFIFSIFAPTFGAATNIR